MSVLFPKDCLAHHLDRPLFRKMNVGTMPCSVYAEQMIRFENDGLDAKPLPETDALNFYQLNHALALVQQKFHPLEPLPSAELALVNRFFDQTSAAARRAIFYLLVICTRETRHLHNKDMWKEKLTKDFGPDVANYVCSLPDSAVTAMGMFKKSPPKCAIGPYVEALYRAFASGSWSSGYGGKAWAKVTDCLRSFVNGDFSMVMLVDTVWTLSHNNGPIFNKGDYYQMYMGQYLIKILDVQRAGMIPTFIHQYGDSEPELKKALTPAIRETNKTLLAMFDLPRKMDWSKVNELGAVQHYNDDGSVGYKSKSAKSKPAKPPVDEFEIYPGFTVPKFKIARAA